MRPRLEDDSDHCEEAAEMTRGSRTSKKKRSRWASAAILCLGAALGFACGSRAPQDVQVGRDESGSQIRLHVGDTLALDLRRGSEGTWRLISYPGSLLALAGPAKSDGHFDLVARQPGKGSVRAHSVVAQCGPPALRGAACPVAALGQQNQGENFIVTVTILE